MQRFCPRNWCNCSRSCLRPDYCLPAGTCTFLSQGATHPKVHWQHTGERTPQRSQHRPAEECGLPAQRHGHTPGSGTHGLDHRACQCKIAHHHAPLRPAPEAHGSHTEICAFSVCMWLRNDLDDVFQLLLPMHCQHCSYKHPLNRCGKFMSCVMQMILIYTSSTQEGKGMSVEPSPTLPPPAWKLSTACTQRPCLAAFLNSCMYAPKSYCLGPWRSQMPHLHAYSQLCSQCCTVCHRCCNMTTVRRAFAPVADCVHAYTCTEGPGTYHTSIMTPDTPARFSTAN